MVKCKDCNKEMRKVKTCTFQAIQINKEIYERDNKHFDVNKKCHDCNIENKKGNYHHFGCDVERCPRCKGQLISCNCKKEGLVFAKSLK